MDLSSVVPGKTRVHFRAFGAERSGLVLSVTRNLEAAYVEWEVRREKKRREVPSSLIFRPLLETGFGLTWEDPEPCRNPTRSAPFYCEDPHHRHPEMHLRDECLERSRRARGVSFDETRRI